LVRVGSWTTSESVLEVKQASCQEKNDAFTEELQRSIWDKLIREVRDLGIFDHRNRARLDTDQLLEHSFRMSNGSTPGQGSAGNVLAAFASLLIPGLGQLLQGRLLMGVLFFVVAGIVWFISLGTLGWIIHLFACLNAALWKPRS